MQQERWVEWPNERERTRIKTAIGQTSAFGGCLGYCDGALLPMDIKPSYIGHSDWFSRKSRYSINSLFVCDDQNRITYMNIGFGGAAHDARVFRNSAVSSILRRNTPFVKQKSDWCFRRFSLSCIQIDTSVHRNIFLRTPPIKHRDPWYRPIKKTTRILPYRSIYAAASTKSCLGCESLSNIRSAC